MTSYWSHYLKQWQHLDLRETKQIIYHSKGFDKSYPKIHFLLNLSHFVKSYGHLCQILACLPCRLTKYGHVTWLRLEISKMFNFGLILHLVSGKVTKFPVEKFSISEVMSRKPHGEGGKHSHAAFRVKIWLFLLSAIPINFNKLIV